MRVSFRCTRVRPRAGRPTRHVARLLSRRGRCPACRPPCSSWGTSAGRPWGTWQRTLRTGGGGLAGGGGSGARRGRRGRIVRKASCMGVAQRCAAMQATRCDCPTSRSRRPRQARRAHGRCSCSRRWPRTGGARGATRTEPGCWQRGGSWLGRRRAWWAAAGGGWRCRARWQRL